MCTRQQDSPENLLPGADLCEAAGQRLQGQGVGAMPDQVARESLLSTELPPAGRLITSPQCRHRLAVPQVHLVA